MITTNKQYILNLSLCDDATFANFYPASNQNIVKILSQLNEQSSGQFFYLYGQSGLGCSHLSMATCHNLGNHGLPITYLTFLNYLNFTPAILDNLEQMFFVCLEDLDLIVGQPAWEEALLHCFNKIYDSGKTLLVTAKTAPTALKFSLPDLQSRINSMLTLQLQNLNDAEKFAALNLRALNRSLNLPIETSRYLLHHYQRDLKTLFANLDQLAQAALYTQHSLTIPFVKKILGQC